MVAYYIVRIGDRPGNSGFENRGSTCAAWSNFEEKKHTEVVEADLATGEVLQRYPHVEAEEMASEFLNPTIQ